MFGSHVSMGLRYWLSGDGSFLRDLRSQHRFRGDNVLDDGLSCDLGLCRHLGSASSVSILCWVSGIQPPGLCGRQHIRSMVAPSTNLRLSSFCHHIIWRFCGRASCGRCNCTQWRLMAVGRLDNNNRFWSFSLSGDSMLARDLPPDPSQIQNSKYGL